MNRHGKPYFGKDNEEVWFQLSRCGPRIKYRISGKTFTSFDTPEHDRVMLKGGASESSE